MGGTQGIIGGCKGLIQALLGPRDQFCKVCV